MTRPLAVLRPEPGNAATCTRAAEAGFETRALPLFAVEALDWGVPDPAQHDALILTSANTLRFGGAGLAALTGLPVLAVGPHTAAAARAAGFDVMAIGSGDGAQIAAFAHAHGIRRALHLTGRDRTLGAGGAIATVLPVYHSVAVPVAPNALQVVEGTIALLHSARAARRLEALVTAAGLDRSRIAIAAFSPAIAATLSAGWGGVAAAATPDDAALFGAALGLSTATGD
ncbi:uroporphyrinogen-III synthase [Sphingomonas glacialis]|uniref:Uroporphyrinogen-III synthase n=1 Tax=Sphingomonas glacialis TaxID=658225 RepID=A0A502FU50_9SPHN|nr:uroporphyrinogen-III synthase [Sphingomonas glacialis]TPG52782.1 uroporphyrinogen-III synthase [Sphingomonas glacialis]